MFLFLAACSAPAPDVERLTNGAVAYDADNDGFADVAIVQRPEQNGGNGIGSLELFYGGPDGLVQSRSASFPISVPYGHARWVGDVNGDGFADAAVATDTYGRPPSISLAYGGPRGSTGTVQVQCNQGVAPDDERGVNLGWVGDLDGDGIDDLMATSGGGRLCVWRGDGDGIEGEPDLFEQVAGDRPATQAMARFEGLGDVDGDGLPDVAVGIELRHGAPTLLGASSELPAFPTSGRADPDGDGRSDIVNERFGPTSFDVFLAGDGSFGGPIDHFVAAGTDVVPVESELVHLGDITGDGRHDVAISIPSRDQGGLDLSTDGWVALLHGTDDGYAPGPPGGEAIDAVESFLPDPTAVELNGFRTGYVIGIGDIDGDGIGDLGVEVLNGGLAWIRGSTRTVGSSLDGYVLVNRAGPRMASTGPGAL